MCGADTDAHETRRRYMMDVRGRKYAGTPASATMGLGFVAVGFARGFWSLGVAAALLGLGNGMSSGLIMTLGTDLAPQHIRGQFIGESEGACSSSDGAMRPACIPAACVTCGHLGHRWHIVIYSNAAWCAMQDSFE
jgi:MFS family permease